MKSMVAFGLALMFTEVGAAIAAAAEVPPVVVHMGRQPSEVFFSKITVSNLRRSYDFYTKVIGLKDVQWPQGVPGPALDDPNPKFTEACLNFSGSPADSFFCLLKREGIIPTQAQADLVWIGIKTADVKAVMSRVEAAQLPIVVSAAPVLGMVVGAIRDPDGYTIELLEVKSVEPLK